MHCISCTEAFLLNVFNAHKSTEWQNCQWAVNSSLSVRVAIKKIAFYISWLTLTDKISIRLVSWGLKMLIKSLKLNPDKMAHIFLGWVRAEGSGEVLSIAKHWRSRVFSRCCFQVKIIKSFWMIFFCSKQVIRRSWSNFEDEVRRFWVKTFF